MSVRRASKPRQAWASAQQAGLHASNAGCGHPQPSVAGFGFVRPASTVARASSWPAPRRSGHRRRFCTAFAREWAGWASPFPTQPLCMDGAALHQVSTARFEPGEQPLAASMQQGQGVCVWRDANQMAAWLDRVWEAIRTRCMSAGSQSQNLVKQPPRPVRSGHSLGPSQCSNKCIPCREVAACLQL